MNCNPLMGLCCRVKQWIPSLDFPSGAVGKESACQCRRCKRGGCDPGLGRTPREGTGNTLHYSCLENPTDRGAWWAQSMGLQRDRYNWAHTHALLNVNLYFSKINVRSRQYFITPLSYLHKAPSVIFKICRLLRMSTCIISLNSISFPFDDDLKLKIYFIRF